MPDEKKETLAEKMSRLAAEQAEAARKQAQVDAEALAKANSDVAAKELRNLRAAVTDLIDRFPALIERLFTEHTHPSHNALTFCVFAYFEGNEQLILTELVPLFNALEKADFQAFTLRRNANGGVHDRDSNTIFAKIHSNDRWDVLSESGGFLEIQMIHITQAGPKQYEGLGRVEYGWLPAKEYAFKSQYRNNTIALGARFRSPSLEAPNT